MQDVTSPQHVPGAKTSPGTLGFPKAQGLYDPANEKDACGVGIVAHIKGHKSHGIVEDAITMLGRMDHRGACGCEPNTGDGAGILTALPHGFLRSAAERDANIKLPDAGMFGAGNVFLPRDPAQREKAKQAFAKIVEAQGQVLLGWRVLPVDPDGADVGPSARSTEPFMEQVFIAGAEGVYDDVLERQLYIIRKHATRLIRNDESLSEANYFYVCSLSTKVIVYKGQLTSGQVMPYYPDLQDERYISHLAMVHSRFSTNTFPSWDRAQPCRFMSHNGEINTLKGNVNWVAAREGLMQSEHFGEDLKKLFPICEPDCSDSGNFDNALELLLMAGRSLPEAVMMMIPEAWENHESMPMAKRAFYEYHSALMEPWDGPASVVFTDGKYIGATLDRNGLRPSRYYVTEDDRVVMASEVGVLDIDPASVKFKGRLQPGRMFLVNFEEGRIIADDELKSTFASARPYGRWLQTQRIDIADLPAPATSELGKIEDDQLMPLLQSFGYTIEHMHLILMPMVRQAKEAMGSMGNDQALAVLSDKPRLLYDYFKQMFAQVTNPPIDPLREEIIMSLQTFIGPEGNLLDTTEQQCHRLQLTQPVLTNKQLGALKQLNHRGWKSKVIDITYDRPATDNATAGEAALADTLDRICREASEAILEGYQLVILSDRNVGPKRLPVSSLLATGAVHHHLVRTHERTRIGLVIESGEAREVHHFCVLFGYGADAVNPYLAFDALGWLRKRGTLSKSISSEKIIRNYTKSINKGVLKVMSKMGISTLASYKGAQIFEALGLDHKIIERCFAGTASRLRGAGLGIIAEEARRRHLLGFPEREDLRLDQLPNPGEYHWRAGGDKHAFGPTAIANVQLAVKAKSYPAYDLYARQCNDDAKSRCTLRGLLHVKTEDESRAIPLEEVEPASEIVKRFRTGAMSLGALSKEAHETLAVAMNRMGGMSNSGEGGEDIVRFTPMENGDSKRSAIKQVASGRFGVTSFYLANADLIQIKIAQGAKPGEGGQLPAHKVDEYIADIRYSTPGVGLISPPPHHDIYSIEDLAQLIYDLKNANPQVPISVKLVSEVGVGTIASGVSKAHADHILISGYDGGTGASPLTSIKHAGLPWELGLAETHQTLVLNDLRSRVRLETDGGLKTGRDLFIAACLGAEEYGYATIPLVAMGCIMMRKCHLNTCPVGICTQDEALRKKFSGQPEHVINFFFMVAEEARSYMAKVGVRKLDDLIGRVDLLEARDAIDHWKADGLDLAPILQPANKPHEDVDVRKVIPQDHGIDEILDRRLIEHATPALEHGEKVRVELPITNLDRTVGTMLSHHVSKKWGENGLPDDTIELNFHGSAGQSLGAWLAHGVTIKLEGDANDYVGKGLSGGKIIVYPPHVASFEAQENIIIGNVALYGATSGEAYFRGVAAERFCVRNSGANAVIEAVGDHACEYMTGGRVVILGKTGRNFAAGMSGGIAYVWDKEGEFLQNCNLGMVELEGLSEEEDVPEVKRLITNHMEYTGSGVAARVLAEWDRIVPQFVKVMPVDYRRVLNQRKAMDQAAIPPGVTT